MRSGLLVVLIIATFAPSDTRACSPAFAQLAAR